MLLLLSERHLFEGYMQRHKHYNIFDDDAIHSKKNMTKITRRRTRNHSTQLWRLWKIQKPVCRGKGDQNAKHISPSSPFQLSKMKSYEKLGYDYKGIDN